MLDNLTGKQTKFPRNAVKEGLKVSVKAVAGKIAAASKNKASPRRLAKNEQAVQLVREKRLLAERYL